MEHDRTLRKIGLAVVTLIVLAAVSWTGVQLDRNTQATKETHDQVLTNTVKLNSLLRTEGKVDDVTNRVGSLEFRVNDLEKRQDKDDARTEARIKAELHAKGHMP